MNHPWTFNVRTDGQDNYGATVSSADDHRIEALIPYIYPTDVEARAAAITWIARWEASEQLTPVVTIVETVQPTQQEIDDAIAALVALEQGGEG